MRRLLIALAILFAVAAAGVGLSYAPDRSVESLHAQFAPPPSQFIAVDGMQVHLRDEGVRDDPLPILLLHGTSASLHTWDGWVAALAPTRRVIRIDLPGFGLTGPNPSGDYSAQSYVPHVARVLDRLGIERAVWVGNSFGGQVAWMAAILNPERVGALILIDAAGYPFVPESLPLGFRLALDPDMAPIVRNLLPRFVVAESVRETYGDPGKVSEATIDLYYALALREGNRQALIDRFAQGLAAHGAMSERIPEIRAPTLILWGGRDRLIPPDNGDRFHADIVGSQLTLFPALGHIPHEEDPAATVARAQAFLASLQVDPQPPGDG
jgi:pimeloyl-ACP methyl ester carboxylesterase